MKGEKKDLCKPDSPHTTFKVFSMRCAIKQKVNPRDTTQGFNTHAPKWTQSLRYAGVATGSMRAQNRPLKSSCCGLTTEHCSSGHFPVPDIKRRPRLSFSLLSTHGKSLPTRLEAGALSSHWPSWKKAVPLPNTDAVVLPSVTFGVFRVHLGSLLNE